MRVVSDEQATTYVFRRAQARGRRLGAGPRLQSYRRLPFAGGGGFGLAPLGEAAPAGTRWRDPEEQGAPPEQQKIQELEARINRLGREKAILKIKALDMAYEQRGKPQQVLFHSGQPVRQSPVPAMTMALPDAAEHESPG